MQYKTVIVSFLAFHSAMSEIHLMYVQGGVTQVLNKDVIMFSSLMTTPDMGGFIPCLGCSSRPLSHRHLKSRWVINVTEFGGTKLVEFPR